MKTRIVLAGLVATMMVLEVSAQRAENDDMYFRAKDREKNKAIEADTYASAKTKKQQEEAPAEEEDNSNPTDSYSARNVNPEYVSRENSEQASEDETDYYLEGYAPPTTYVNNSYYGNNTNWARNSYYGNAMWNSPFYGYGYYDPWMSPYGGGYYDPWMSPYGMGPSYGWRTGWSVSFMYGNYWNPYGGYGYGYPNYGGYYGYPAYYGGGNYYYESPTRGATYGKRPSRHSATVRPERTVTRPRSNDNNSTVSTGGRTRTRQTQEDYYVRPSRRTPFFTPDPSPSRNQGSDPSTPSSRPTRTRSSFDNTPSSTPSYSPSPSRSGGSSGSSGGGGGRSGGSSGGSGGSRPRGN